MLKMKRLIILIYPLLTIGSCKYQDQNVATVNRDFQLPVIVQAPTKDKIEFKNIDFLDDSRFMFYGKYKFTDTLYFEEHRKLDTTYQKDYISDYSRPGINDPLTTDGFQIFVDYNTTMYNKDEYMQKGEYFFPVYLVNETTRTKVFTGKDNYVLGIQEAVDSSQYYRWRPIECRGFDYCGNGNFGLKIHPGEFVMFLVPKYIGNEKNFMRIRLKIGESLYLSHSFFGSFNRQQFDLKEDSYVKYRLIENKASTIQWMFFGATPKGYDPKY